MKKTFASKMKTQFKAQKRKKLFLQALKIVGDWSCQRAREEAELRRALLPVPHACGCGYDSQSSDSFAELQMVFDKLDKLAVAC